MRVCYFGSYDPLYPRNALLISGLRRSGVDVYECHHSLKGATAAAIQSSGLTAYLKYIYRMPAHQLSMIVASRRIPDVDALIVGFFGHHDIPFARLLSRLRGIPLVFDPFVSVYDTLVSDRKFLGQTSIAAGVVKKVEIVLSKFPDMIIADTKANADYWGNTFGVPQHRLAVIPVGADEDIFYPRPTKNVECNRPFLVLFYGTFVPLQGVEIIVRAAKLLEHEKVMFRVIGSGQTFPEVKTLAEELGPSNLSFIDWVDFTQLPQEIANADVCLGIFGVTPKAGRVVPNKAFQAIAIGKPLITRDSPAARSIFVDRENVLLCEPGNAQALADAIVVLRTNAEFRDHIAQCGLGLFREKFTKVALGQQLLSVINGLVNERS